MPTKAKTNRKEVHLHLQERLDRDPDAEYILEMAPSGRAICRGGCEEVILAQTVRIKTIKGTSNFSRHAECLGTEAVGNIRKVYGSFESVPGLAELPAKGFATLY
ncbi:MAG: hypothetical protein SGCHY_004079 [Lobulomycetales sp.]